jgi:hypothetical protein
MCCANFILGPLVWIMATRNLKEMRAGRMDPSGEGITKTARILGMISTGLAVFGLICFAFYH